MDTPTKHPEKLALACFSISIFCLLFSALLGYFISHSPTIQCAYLSLSVAVMFSAMAFWSFRLVRWEKEESDEQERIRAAYSRNDLFTEDEVIHHSAAQTRRVAERYLIPLVTTICGFLIVAFTYHMKRGWTDSSTSERIPSNLAGLSTILFIICLMAGSYGVGVSRERGYNWLRPAGHWLKLSAGIYLVPVAAIFADYAGIVGVEVVATKTASAFLMVFGAEMIFNVIIGFYRTEIKEEHKRPVFESLSLGLVTEPGRIARNITSAVEYQFGLKVSDTRFDQFTRRTVTPYILLSTGLLYLLDCFVLIEADEKGIIERFGKPVSQRVLRPGLYCKLPRPFESARKFPIKRVKKVNVGFQEQLDDDDGVSKDKKDTKSHLLTARTVLWTQRHYHSETHYLVASNNQEPDAHVLRRNGRFITSDSRPAPMNVLAAAIPVFYKIDEEKLFDYAYNYEEPEKILEFTASQVIVNFFASVDFLDLVGASRLAYQSELEERVRQAVLTLDPPLGIRLQFVGLMGMHPPVEVAKSYQRVAAAQEEAANKIFEAERYATNVRSKTTAECSRLILTAEGYRVRQAMVSSGEAERFQQRLQAYQTAPLVFKTRNFLDVIEHRAAAIKKYVIANQTKEVFIIDLQQKVRPDLLEDFEITGQEE